MSMYVSAILGIHRKLYKMRETTTHSQLEAKISSSFPLAMLYKCIRKLYSIRIDCETDMQKKGVGWEGKAEKISSRGKISCK